MMCPNCGCPDEMDEVHRDTKVLFGCLGCDYSEERQELAIDRTCLNCQSPPGRKCTQPTNTGRVPVEWLHSARTHP